MHSSGHLGPYQCSVHIPSHGVANYRLRISGTECQRACIIPLLNNARQGLDLRPSSIWYLENHGSGALSLCRVVAMINGGENVAQKCRVKASLPQAGGEGATDAQKVQPLAAVPSIPNELGANEAAHDMRRVTRPGRYVQIPIEGFLVHSVQQAIPCPVYHQVKHRNLNQ